MKKTSKSIMSKYDYVPAFRNVSEVTTTVPDLVLSMSDIYKKYLVTGDISKLPGRVRPIVVDDGSEFDSTFDPEEHLEVRLHAMDLRNDALEARKRETQKKTSPKSVEKETEEEERSDDDVDSQTTD